MDNKVTKQRVNDHLEYDWFKYLIIVGLVIAAIAFAFSQINSERDSENVNIFFSCYEYYDNDFSQSAKNQMASDKYDASVYGANIVRSIGMEFQSPTTNEYSQLLSTHGAVTSDILIVGRSVLKYKDEEDDFSGAYAYTELTDAALELMGIAGREDIELLRVNNEGKRVTEGGKAVGVRVDTLRNIKKIAVFEYSGTDETKEYDSEFYLVINGAGGVNIGGFNNKSKAVNRQTFFCLKVFFEMYG